MIGDFPILAILVLLLPAVILAWRSRGKKHPTITSSCCLPVIDESKRPFAIPDESELPETTPRATP